MTLFHSINPKQELYDFIYKDDVGAFHAFQATRAKRHTAPLHMIQTLRNDIGNSRLALYYLIPADGFDGFVTEPVKPVTDELTSVWHILIPKPNKEKIGSQL